MKKTISLISLGSLLISGTASAIAIVNTSDLRGYIGSFYMGSQSLEQASGFADLQLFGAGGLGFAGQYADYEVDEDTDRRFDGDIETYSGSIGYVHAFDGFNLGITLTGIDSEMDAEGTDLNPNVALETEGDGFLVTIGAAKQWEKLSLSLKGTMGELSFETTRENGNGPKDADYDVTLYQIELLAMYALLENEDFALSPFAKLGYASLENDGFEESNAPDAVSIDDFEDDRPYGELGLQGQLRSLGAFVPYASVSVWQDLGDDEVEVEGTDAATNPYSFEIPDAAETVIKGELGFGYSINENFTLGASLGYFSGDSIDGYNAGLSVIWTF